MGLLSAVFLVTATADAFSVREGRMTRLSEEGQTRESMCRRAGGRFNFSFICSDGSTPNHPTFGMCGNGTVELGEECDGSAPDGYVCSAQCQLETDDSDNGDDDTTSDPQCGNEVVESGEECDGSAPDGYVCTNSCMLHDITLVGDGVVINEVHANLDNRHGVEPSNEWIELYNAGDVDVDLQDWYIVDSEGQSSYMTKSVVLAPGEFVLMSSDNSTYTKYWNIPEGTHLVSFGASLGSGLDDEGDALRLYNNEGALIDAMSYGNDTSEFQLPVMHPGDSLSRVAPGVDTDSRDDWKRLDQPTPGA